MAVLVRRRSGLRPSPDAMTLVEHLGELRRRLVVCLVAFVVAAVAAYVLYPDILRILEQPYCAAKHAHGAGCALLVTGPLEGFGVRLNVTGYGGLFLASPVILFQLWRFVTPGLRANEKRYAIPFVLATLLLFAFGAYVAWLTFPHALGFLIAVSGPGIMQLFSASRYLQLVLALMAIFGLAFEFPVVLVALQLAGVLTPARLGRWRRVAIVVIVVVAAIATPSSDPFSMLAMAVPMYLFYELSILVGRLLGR
ncbi:MAG TPA: twin-arginine translocase subunit TatC [Acidimicrobiales bacterium]|jgi:sec-independent protein translocase protein TatC|nr:twin-arginine translocase subunit TatC [Acidimicrobiales bacterium]